MTKKTSATITRIAKTGKFAVRKENGGSSEHTSGKKTPKSVSASITRNRDALKRLANR